eukprot:TRINITY_DN8362_c0_g2_i1.p2 TRINITY_DN8362_c0_g2~~TRINITY_DN8362_c0_g2_i1.p2  ORF type:complete len:215 (+),score=37.86 TRINITY_DN8362_c0_g2_i1:67-645(+)
MEEELEKVTAADQQPFGSVETEAGGIAARATAADDSLQAQLSNAIQSLPMKTIRGIVRRGAPLVEACYELGPMGEHGTVVDLALYYHRPDVALSLMRLAEETGRGQDVARASTCAVAWAARDGRFDLLTDLLSCGADPLRKSWQGRTPLHAAMLRGFCIRSPTGRSVRPPFPLGSAHLLAFSCGQHDMRSLP